MARRTARLATVVELEYVPLPVEQVAVLRASLLLLVDWVMKDLRFYPEPSRKYHWIGGSAWMTAH